MKYEIAIQKFENDVKYQFIIYSFFFFLLAGDNDEGRHVHTSEPGDNNNDDNGDDTGGTNAGGLKFNKLKLEQLLNNHLNRHVSKKRRRHRYN